MKKITFLVLLLPLLFTSCFEVVEDVTLNKDGSGKVALILNFSQSKTKLKTIMLMDSINGYKIPSKTEITKEFDNVIRTLRGIKGLSNIQKNIDFDEYIFKISCNFSDIEKLNQVVATFSAMNNMQVPKGLKHFSYNKATKVFTRNYEYDLAKEFRNVRNDDRKAFENAAYITVYHFENTIISSKNKTAHIAKNKKAIMLKVSAQDIINNRNTIKNQIKLN